MYCQESQEMEQPMQTSSVSPAELPWKEWVTKGAATGIIAGIARMLLFEDKSLFVARVRVPGAIAMGIGAAAGSVGTNLAHQYILPMIPHNQKYEKMESAAIALVASGLGTYAATNLLGNAAFGPAFAVGAGSYLAGDYAWHNLLNKAEGGLLI